jgi:DNA-binding transcriptional LysR family regulator
LFRDELLERGRGTMYLTPKAEALRAPLKSLLANLVELVDPPEVPLAEIRQTLRIATADYPALSVIGPLQQELQNPAPGIDLVIQPWHGVVPRSPGRRLPSQHRDHAVGEGQPLGHNRDEIGQELLAERSERRRRCHQEGY